MLDHLDRFDLVLVLTLDDHTQRSRLAASSRDNDFGRVGSTAAWSQDYRVQVETDLLARGCRAIDARPPLDIVVRTVLDLPRCRLCTRLSSSLAPSSAFPKAGPVEGTSSTVHRATNPPCLSPEADGHPVGSSRFREVCSASEPVGHPRFVDLYRGDGQHGHLGFVDLRWVGVPVHIVEVEEHGQ